MTLGDIHSLLEMISTIKLVIVLIILSIIICVSFFPFIFKAYARSRADRILYGRRPCTEKQITRYIAILTWCNNWISVITEEDENRINRLRDMLKEMQHPHG